MRSKVTAVALGAALTLGAMGGAQAAPRTTVNLSFFVGPASSAGWTTEADGNKAIALSVEVFGWAGVHVNRSDGKALDDVQQSPSFRFRAGSVGNSGGSPRLVVSLSDGGQIHLHANTWTGDWQTVSGAAGEVVTYGGTCGGQVWGQDWAFAKACHAGTTVTSVAMVSDSWWLTTPWAGYTTLVDDIQWDGKTFESAADNRR